MFPLTVESAASGNYELLAGAAAGNLFFGYSGVAGNLYGALDPDEYRGIFIEAIATSNAGIPLFWLEGIDVGEDIWSIINLGGNFGSGQETVIWDRIADGFVYDPNNAGSGISTWQAPGATEIIVNGNTYTVSIL